VVDAIDSAAEKLGNLRSTARVYYVHPGIVLAFESGALADMVENVAPGSGARGYRRGEWLLLELLPDLDAVMAAADRDGDGVGGA
jgi:DNA topoisomerase-1